MLTSPEAIFFNALLEHLKTNVPELRYIERDLGQLENYEIRPAVAWPCCLVDIEEFKFTESNDDNIQIGEGIISLRIASIKYTDTHNLNPQNIREIGLQFFELENKVYRSLQGKAIGGFSKFLRRASGTERRDDDITVRIMKFATSVKDDSAKPKKVSVPRPEISIGGNTPS